MTTLVPASAWRPLGRGRLASSGSLTDAALAAKLAAYKHQVAGTYRSLAPADITTGTSPRALVLLPVGLRKSVSDTEV